MAVTNEKLKLLQEIHKKEEALYQGRNEKYGDSFGRTFQKYGPLSAILRLEDKLNRAETLINLEMEGSNEESLVDTLMDLSNYANMAIIELKAQEETPTLNEFVEKAPRKKKARKPKTEKVPEDKNPQPEKGPFDGLSKTQLVEIISATGGACSKRFTREKLLKIIDELPKATVAVVMTAMKKEKTSEETPDDPQE